MRPIILATPRVARLRGQEPCFVIRPLVDGYTCSAPARLALNGVSVRFPSSAKHAPGKSYAEPIYHEAANSSKANDDQLEKPWELWKKRASGKD